MRRVFLCALQQVDCRQQGTQGIIPPWPVRIYMLLMLTFINISEDPDRWQGPGRTVASRSKNLKKPYLQSIWGAVQVDQDPEKKYIWLFDFAVLCVKGSSGSQVAGSWRFRSPPGDPAMIRKYYTLYRSIRSVIPGSCHWSHEAFLVVHAGGRVHSWIFYKNIFFGALWMPWPCLLPSQKDKGKFAGSFLGHAVRFDCSKPRFTPLGHGD